MYAWEHHLGSGEMAITAVIGTSVCYQRSEAATKGPYMESLFKALFRTLMWRT